MIKINQASEKLEHFIKRIRWEVFCFLNNDNGNNHNSDNVNISKFGFTSIKYPLQSQNWLNIISSVETDLKKIKKW